MKYTIHVEAGDNGEVHAVGLFGTFDAALKLAREWQEAENPSRDPDGMHYVAVRVRTVAEWRATR